ncbi:MAG: hypothetical protein K6T85_14055, partial [Gorillibacterium sp.]|nr:hypothetical protein [Gorillibacterium sp.]
MFPLKSNKANIGLALILLLSLLMSVYSIGNYSGDAASTKSIGRQSQLKLGDQIENRPLFSNGGSRDTSAPHDPLGSSTNRGGFSSGNRFGGSTQVEDRYSTPLMIYAFAFLGVFITAYLIYTRRRIATLKVNKKLMLWTLLGVGFFLRIAISPWVGGHPYDTGLFKSWATSAAANLSTFYLNGSSDYPPFYIYVLYIVGKAVSVSTFSPYFTLLIKLPSLLADVLTAFLIYRLASKRLPLFISVMLTAFYLFNPAVFINSTFWGQVDSFFTLLLVCALIAVSKDRVWLAAALF